MSPPFRVFEVSLVRRANGRIELPQRVICEICANDEAAAKLLAERLHEGFRAVSVVAGGRPARDTRMRGSGYVVG